MGGRISSQTAKMGPLRVPSFGGGGGKEKRKPGRPKGSGCLYTPELASEICERLSGGESLRTICEDSGMPDLSTVLRWLDIPDFSQAYARAREVQGDVMDSEILDTANQCKAGLVESRAAAVAIGAYQWRAGRLAPKRYGDRQSVEISGSLDLGTAIAAGKKRAEGSGA